MTRENYFQVAQVGTKETNQARKQRFMNKEQIEKELRNRSEGPFFRIATRKVSLGNTRIALKRTSLE